MENKQDKNLAIIPWHLRIPVIIVNVIFKNQGMQIQARDGESFLVKHELFSLYMRHDFFRRWLFEIIKGNGELSFGEGYMATGWGVLTGELEDVLWKFNNILESDSLWAAILKIPQSEFLFGQKNNAFTAKKNVAHHYDLGNELFKLFLDENMNYSSAIYELAEAENESLEQAQLRKNQLLVELLKLDEVEDVLEIGCGWGYLSRTLAKKGIHVSGISLAQKQINWCKRQQIQNQLLEPGLKYHLVDYRDFCKKHKNSFDRVVSVEMIDHVGHRQYVEFFNLVFDVLKPGGSMVMQILVRPLAGRTTRWIDKYIFPGGYIASFGELSNYIEQSKFGVDRIYAVEYGGEHYARTLREWKNRFTTNWEKIKSKGYDDKFFRMWDYYLSASAMVFYRAGFTTMHLKLSKPKQRNFKNF